MNLIRIFTDYAPNKVFISIFSGILAGVLYALLIPLLLASTSSSVISEEVNRDALQTFWSYEVANYGVAVIFFPVCIAILIFRSVSQIMLVRIALDVTKDLRTRLYKTLLASSLRDIEDVGPSRILTVVTMDIGRIILGGKMLPDLFISIVTLLGMLVYLFVLNNAVFQFVIFALVFGVVLYQIPMKIGTDFFLKSRVHMDELQESVRGLIYGIKELKLNRAKSDDYLENALMVSEIKVLDADKLGGTFMRVAMNFGDLVSFFVIGIIAFVFVNYATVSVNELLGVVMVLLYITGPVGIIVNYIPQVAMAKVSLGKVNSLLDDLPDEDINRQYEKPDNWQKITFNDVCYQYNSKGVSLTEPFKLGPLNFTLYKGEVTFIVGGNGSGKSTLSKLLTLQYSPSSGTINFDGKLIGSHNIHSYRQEISAIFFDFFLFDRTLGLIRENLKIDVDNYLKELGLDKKVTYSDGRFSTLALSDGQRRRLALLVSYLDDKELYLFDEWAADQDPRFKKVFYQTILGDLKRKNKTVIVISHDDRYFNIADNIIQMADGKITE